MQEVIADAVLSGSASRARYPKHACRIRFILTEQQGRFWLGVEVENAEVVMLRPDDGIR